IARARSWPPSSAASSVRRPIERAASARRKPACAACRAVAAPMPLEAPVIRNTGSETAEVVIFRRMQDRARIHVQAGAGGDGCLSFRREARVPKGGPDGGDGGRGGDVVLVCDDSLRDLESFRRRSHFKARRGGHGQGALRHGRDGETLEIAAPPGTTATAEAAGTTPA